MRTHRRKIERVGFSGDSKTQSLSEIDVGRDNTHIRQITMCQRRKYVLPLLLGSKHQHCQNGSYGVLVMPLCESPRGFGSLRPGFLADT